MKKTVGILLTRSIARKFLAAVLLICTVLTTAFAGEIPIAPQTLSEFEEVWDYVVESGAEHLEFHYDEKQSVNVYQKYITIIDLMVRKYRYVYPEKFNYLSLKDYSFVEDEGGRYGFTMVLAFGDLSGRTKREYYTIAAEEAEKLYHEVTDGLSPTLPQKKRVQLLCNAIANRVVYKNDGSALCHTAYCALVNGYAVCDGYTSLLNILLRLDGIECVGRLGYAGGNPHEWTYAKLDGEWTNVDATWVDGGRYEYVALTDEEIAETHTVDLSYHELVNREKENNKREKKEQEAR